MAKTSAFVISFLDNESMKLTFFWNDKEFEFNRLKNEMLDKTLKRIALKLQPKNKNKKKPKGENLSSKMFEVEVYKDNVLCNSGISNEDCFQEGNTLKINGIEFSIKVNLPTVDCLKLPDSIMSGFPVIPYIKILFGNIECSKFSWYKSKSPTDSWILVGERLTYTPTNEDISCFLKCICLPESLDLFSSVSSKEQISKVTVSANPGVCLFDKRHLFTPSVLNSVKEFRIVTYNILADVFADTEFARSVLYPYCPPYALNCEYRMQLLLKEILGYHSDLIALQECEKKMFQKYLYPVLSQHGFSGMLNRKPGQMPEGEALFYRKERFEHIKDLTLPVREMLQLECNKYLLEKLNEIPSLSEKILKKSTIGQIQILKCLKTNQVLCVVNTHLYYKPGFDDIRLLQMVALINNVYEELNKFPDDVTLVVLGDFNTCIGEPLLDYLNGIDIKKDHQVWKLNTNGVDLYLNLKCPFKLSNLTGLPPFTNYVEHFKNTLDYIFVEEHKLKRTKFVPLPEEEDVKTYTALPSIVAPSDHLPLIIDVKWK